MDVLFCGLEGHLSSAVSRLFPGANHSFRLPETGTWDVIVHDPVGSAAGGHVGSPALDTYLALTRLNPGHYVQISSMALFDAYGPGWEIHEKWATRPTSLNLPMHLAELAAREVSRECDGRITVLRLPHVAGHEPGPLDIHIDDAADAIRVAIESPSTQPYVVVHATPGQGRYPLARFGRPPFSFSARHPAPAEQMQAPEWPPAPLPVTTAEPVRRVAIFGAGGPMGASAAEALVAQGALVRQISRSPIAVQPTGTPQSLGAPLAFALAAPHEQLIGTISDPRVAAEGIADCQAVINLAVERNSPLDAFEVNIRGTYNLLAAAQAAGVPKVVLVGPVQTKREHPVGYAEDVDVGVGAPPRPGAHVYFLTQFLAEEAARVLAAEWGLSCPILLFNMLVDPARSDVAPGETYGVSWRDAGTAMAAAVNVKRLPCPAPSMDILVPGPQGRWAPSKATELLGWRPLDDLSHFWLRTSNPYII